MKFSLKEQYIHELKSFLFYYPKFVTSFRTIELQKEIPVFVFHTIEPNPFENQLKFLKENNYNTLSADELFNHITCNYTAPTNSVVLTFDDGRSSFWRYGFPLLKKYNMKGILFIIPGLTQNEDIKRLNLFNYWNKECTLKEIAEQDTNDESICNWKEIKEIFNSGFVNIESHSLFHKEVFVDPKPVDFITSDTSTIPFNTSITAYYNEKLLEHKIKREEYFGFPLFKSASLFSGKHFFTPNKEVLDFCHDFYNKNFLKEKEWKVKLNVKLNDENFLLNNLTWINNPYESIFNDLLTSRKIIKSFLGIDAGDHLCVPWTISSNITSEAIKKAEYKTCFLGLLPNKSINKPGDSPYNITRIKNDFIFRLPGQTRKNLLSIYGNKLKRRISHEKPF